MVRPSALGIPTSYLAPALPALNGVLGAVLASSLYPHVLPTPRVARRWYLIASSDECLPFFWTVNSTWTGASETLCTLQRPRVCTLQASDTSLLNE